MNEPALIEEILRKCKTIAVVGLTNKEGRASVGVSRFMQSRGYQLDREFLNDERPQVTNAPEQCSYRGFLFKRADG